MMLSVVDDSGCYADLTGNTGLVEAVVYQVPVANAGSDHEICGNDLTLDAVKSISGSTGTWTAVNANFDDAQSPTSHVALAGYGQFTLVWTETNWQCSDEDEAEVICYEQPQVPDAGSDQVLDFTYATQMEALPLLIGEGTWEVISGSADFNDETIPDALVTELDELNVLRWTVTNGVCEAVSDDVEVSVLPLGIKKGFTPNDDTRNDYFDVGAENAEKISIRVFNILGTLVFESDDYNESNLWYGRNMNGEELPEGTYYYIINIKLPGREREMQFRSFVELLR
jgi:gliding motility-associated-like protein